MKDIEIVRRAYAKQTLAAAGINNPMLEAAFAAVPREDYLGPGPWPILRWGRGYTPSPSADPVYLYTNDLVGLDTVRNINNGQPSLHAYLIDAAAPAAGGHVVHIGAGTGYYTAIMAELAGPSGRVTAIEFDSGLAARAAENLAALPQITVAQGDGAEVDFDAADVIYVNAGATRPADNWLDRLREGGRLILPLTTRQGFMAGPDAPPIQRHGAVFRIERRGGGYRARWLSPVSIFPCEGARDEASEAALEAAFEKGGWEKVTRLYCGDPPPEDTDCWLKAPGWSLACD